MFLPCLLCHKVSLVQFEFVLKIPGKASCITIKTYLIQLKNKLTNPSSYCVCVCVCVCECVCLQSHTFCVLFKDVLTAVCVQLCVYCVRYQRIIAVTHCQMEAVCMEMLMRCVCVYWCAVFGVCSGVSV